MSATTTPATFRQWLIEQYAEDGNTGYNTLRDIAEHGADAGFGGLIYTSECRELFDRYGDEIWTMAVDDAESQGFANVAEMIAGFSRSDMLSDLDSFKNLMVWYAAEAIARDITNS